MDKKDLEAQVKAEFDKIDADHDGKLTKDEVKDYVKKLGSTLAEEEWENVLNKCNPGGTTITFDQMYKTIPEFMQMLTLFTYMDKNGDKKLDMDEVKQALKAIAGEAPPDEEMKAFFAAMDTDKDGMISFDEFLKFKP